MPAQRLSAAARDEDQASQAVRLSAAAYNALRELASEAGQPLVRCLDDLVRDAYQRRLWERYAKTNRSLQGDSEALAAQHAEEVLWAVADVDGLDPDEGIEWDASLEDAASW